MQQKRPPNNLVKTGIKLWLKKTIFCLLFFIANTGLFAQKNTDYKFIFKTWFFLERENENIKSGNEFDIKDSSLFAFFNSVIDLKIDTLKQKMFTDNFCFLAVTPYKKNIPNSDSIIIYRKYKLASNRDVHINIPINNCNGYVVCINKSNGRSYRLKGFYGNDFLSFLKEVKEDYINKRIHITNYPKLSTKKILKNYEVEGIDFSCIYNGMTSGEIDIRKYPCLESCSNLIITVH